jgi:hypothetical protein
MPLDAAHFRSDGEKLRQVEGEPIYLEEQC